MYKIHITPRKRLLVVWFNPKRLSYYYTYVTGFYTNYFVGYKNQYGHSVIMIFELIQTYHKTPLKKRLVRRLISLLETIERR